MKEFKYTIKDELGIHARPARMVVQAAKSFTSQITIVKDGGAGIDATRLMALMTLGVKYDNEVIVTADGEDEDEAIATMKKLFEENL